MTDLGTNTRHLLHRLDDAAPAAPAFDTLALEAGAPERHRGRTVLTVAATAGLVAAGLVGLAATRGDDDSRAAMTAPSAPDGEDLRWRDGTDMIIYVSQGSDESVAIVREALTDAADLVEFRYLDAAASLAEAQIVLTDDPATLAALTEENVTTAFYVTRTDDVTSDELTGIAQVMRQLPGVRRVDVDVDDEAPLIPIDVTATTVLDTTVSAPSSGTTSP